MVTKSKNVTKWSPQQTDLARSLILQGKITAKQLRPGRGDGTASQFLQELRTSHGWGEYWVSEDADPAIRHKFQVNIYKLFDAMSRCGEVPLPPPQPTQEELQTQLELEKLQQENLQRQAFEDLEDAAVEAEIATKKKAAVEQHKKRVQPSVTKMEGFLEQGTAAAASLVAVADKAGDAVKDIGIAAKMHVENVTTLNNKELEAELEVIDKQARLKSARKKAVRFGATDEEKPAKPDVFTRAMDYLKGEKKEVVRPVPPRVAIPRDADKENVVENLPLPREPANFPGQQDLKAALPPVPRTPPAARRPKNPRTPGSRSSRRLAGLKPSV